MKSIFVFKASPAYAYCGNNEYGEDVMLEKHLSIEFIASSYTSAIIMAVNWANNRWHNVIKDFYGESFLSSIKVYVIEIAEIDDKGSTNTRNRGCFFEWKHDWPGSIEDYIQSAKRCENKGLFSKYGRLKCFVG